MPGLGKADENLSDKHLIVAAAIDAGVKQSEIAKALHYTDTHVSRIKQKVKDFQWLTAKRIKKAVKAVDYFTDVDNYKEDGRIKPSDVLSAAKMQLDRAFPLAAEAPQQSFSFTQINITPSDVNQVFPVQSQSPDQIPQDIVIDVLPESDGKPKSD